MLQGEITCATSLEYGVTAKVAQPPAAAAPNNTSDGDAEGVGAFGPSFAGVDDNQPCTSSGTPFDVAVQKNADSGDFDPEGDTGYSVQAGTTARRRQPRAGPIAGDLEQVVDSSGGGENPLPASCADFPEPTLRALCEALQP